MYLWCWCGQRSVASGKTTNLGWCRITDDIAGIGAEAGLNWYADLIARWWCGRTDQSGWGSDKNVQIIFELRHVAIEIWYPRDICLDCIMYKARVQRCPCCQKIFGWYCGWCLFGMIDAGVRHIWVIWCQSTVGMQDFYAIYALALGWHEACSYWRGAACCALSRTSLRALQWRWCQLVMGRNEHLFSITLWFLLIKFNAQVYFAWITIR